MKKALIILVALAVFGLMTGVALANDPAGSNMTYTESGNTPNGAGYNANTPVTTEANMAGASAWSYKDKADSSRKFEGSYRAFDHQTEQLYDGSNLTGRDSGPHGGYNTTSNKCKTCHAVHRATGTFALMRVDTPDEACEYCHIGDHRHSVVDAFWAAGTIYPSNGHTMGAGDTIPDSSVWQWEEQTNITAGDDATYTIRARRYNASKNKLMRWTMHGGKWIRVGPTLLRCQSCHQPHNAFQQVWKPAKSVDNGATSWTSGYKLLRLSPSGGIASGLVNGETVDTGSGIAAGNSSYDRVNPGARYIEFPSGTDPRLKVVQRATIDVRATTVPVDDQGTSAVAWAGGANRTGYTAFRYHSDGRKPGQANGKYDSIFGNVPVYETSMSFFCADCHNLNIAGKDLVDAQLAVGKFGDSMLGDRSHAIPFMITDRTSASKASSGFHCYSCHNNDMPYVSRNTSYSDLTHTANGSTVTLDRNCNNCHVSPTNYQKLKQTYRQFQGVEGGSSLSDWPHSGPSAGYKLLNSAGPTASHNVAAAWDSADTANGEASGYDVRQPYTGGANQLDKICLICHGSEQSRSVGYDK